MDSIENLMARVEAMMERGQAFSEPEALSCTDRMLDLLLARGSPGAHARPRSPQTAASSRGGTGSNWLDLPSLQELIEIRRALLEQDGGSRMLGPDVDPKGE